jgi:cytochrome c oxidase assembly protein subunit 20
VGTSLLSYEYCMYRRKLEKEGMMRAARVIESKRVEKEAAAELRRQEKKATEEKAAQEAAAKRSWYKLW